MITYTVDTKPARIYTPAEILAMSPAKLRRELSGVCAIDTDLAGKIEAEVGFAPRWSKMATYQYTMVALAWAMLEPCSALFYGWANLKIQEFMEIQDIANV